MKRSAAILAGIVITLALVLVWLATAGLVQRPRLPWIPSAAPTPSQTSTPWPYALSWQRENALAGRCDVLRVDHQGHVWFGTCRQVLATSQLTQNEARALQDLRSRYAADDALYRINPGALDSETIRLRFAGRGAVLMDSFGRAEVSHWAAAVHARLALEAQQVSLVALARGHLAGRLNLSPTTISVVSSEAVTWPDRCLGLGGSTPCQPIPTQGLRIVLLANGQQFEYRTDLLGTVLPLDTHSPAGLTPTAAVALPTWTPTPAIVATQLPTHAIHAPTATLRPSPTATRTPTIAPRPSIAPTVHPPDDEVWIGAYYANKDLIEPPVLRRSDALISFNWGNLSPDPALPNDRFSVRWTRRIDFRRGYYQFDIQCDDGVRLWVDNVLIMDHWRDGYTEHSAEAYVPGGLSPVVLEYYENEGLAETGMTWRLIQPGPRRTATPTAEPHYDGWRGAYFNNTLLLGEPLVVRDDSDIVFDWEEGRPDDRLPADRFGVRWTRRMHLNEGAYRFNASVDDGIRLWIDDRLCIDDWDTGSVRDVWGYRWLPGGEHDLRCEYFEEIGDATVSLDWTRLQAFPAWRASYFDNRHLEGDPIAILSEDEIDHNWKEEAPLVGLPGDDFSVRWTRPVQFTSARYRFKATVDDGIRLWLDDVLLIDEWHDADQEDYVRLYDLVAGTYDIKVEYYENDGNARCSIEWSQE